MSNETVISATQSATPQKGRLSWMVSFLEVILVIGYFILGGSAIMDFIFSFDLASLFEGILDAIYFLIGGTVITTIMCFIPIFKSKNNMYIAVWNIVWLGFNVCGFLAN